MSAREVLFVSIVAFSTALIIFVYAFVLPARVFSTKEVVVLIPKGASLKEISNELKKNGVINSSLAFRALAKLKKVDSRLQHGEYVFPARVSPLQVLKKLVEGDNIKRIVLVRPCDTIETIKKTISESGLLSREEVDLGFSSGALLEKFKIPYPSFEGYIFPETYTFSRPISPEELVEVLLKFSFKKFEELDLETRGKKYNFSLHDVITLASIIEAETPDKFEKYLISSVFHNRLRLGMPLQADPTVAYALSKDGASLTKEDLKTYHQHNTYINKGLPPSPICSPGADALDAAVNPATTNFLYFVSDGKGKHKFSTNLKDHNLNVKQYRETLSQP